MMEGFKSSNAFYKLYMDPSKLTSVEQLQKRTLERLRVPYSAISKDYNYNMSGVDIYGKLKTSYEIDCKSKFWYYLRIFFDLTDSFIVNTRVIYRKKVKTKVSLLNFKIILAKSLVNRFSS